MVRFTRPFTSDSIKAESTTSLLNAALALGIVTIGYNIIEGIISIWFGWNDETLALLGFGVDSFVEVISGAGIVHMVLRMRKSSIKSLDKFERQALVTTGWGFYLLTVALSFGAVINVFQKKHPETTVFGIFVSVISIVSMWWLMRAKMKTGLALHSDAIIADANCTKTCLMLSMLLFASSVLYEWLHVGLIDVIGSIGIAWFAWKEGTEAIETARTGKLVCSCTKNAQSS
ncbi:MAG: hypothetical protein WCK32_07895 [Chlorobiaceae bacterium]